MRKILNCRMNCLMKCIALPGILAIALISTGPAAAVESKQATPAVFTGNFYEVYYDGSLVIEVEMNVRKAGTYRVAGNLKNQTGFRATTQTERTLQPGIQRVALLFFGKSFHDKRANGPYSLAEVAAVRNTATLKPGMSNGSGTVKVMKEFVPTILAGFNTRPYQFIDFANRDYSRLEQQAFLSQYPY